MSKLNTSTRSQAEKIYTHEGAPAKRINAEMQLCRSVMSCLLWEDEFYEDGETIADRIASGVQAVKPQVAFDIAVEARSRGNLRHVPLWIANIMSKLPEHKLKVSALLEKIIQRADELSEFVAIYFKDGKHPLSKQVKKGLAAAFGKFDEYALAKYNRDGKVKLRDVLRLVRVKPKDKEQEKLWKKLIGGFCSKCGKHFKEHGKAHKFVEAKLEIPDTWEVQLSTGKDKKETWERLMKEEKLGGLALLRNLRNMIKANVDEKLVFKALAAMKTECILPYRFIAASRFAPQWESKIEVPMLKCLEGATKLPGKTILLVDVSGSMDTPMSGKSDLQRVDAACGLAIVLREVCESVRIFSFSNETKAIADRHGFALRDALVGSQQHGGTNLGEAVNYANSQKYDRLIVITDEQSQSPVGQPTGKGYMINVASNKNGVGYGKWIHVDGFSEAIVDYICSLEILEALESKK